MESATHDEDHTVRRGSKCKEGGVRGAEEAWEAVRDALRRRLSRDAYQRWFRCASPGGVAAGELVVRVPNEIHHVWIEANYLPELVAAVAEAMDGVRAVKLVVDPGVAGEAAAGGGVAGGDGGAAPGWVAEAAGEAAGEVVRDDTTRRLKQAALNPLFNFERFVVGANSQFAHAASTAVANRAATGFNPLFIHGRSGLGKTHLMQAIGQQWLRERQGVRVLYLTCERFTNEFIDAVRKGDIERFRRRYRNVELLLLDDVQFLGGKERSQEEFFHTFNTLLDGQKQVVLTSDKPACEIKSLEPRLVSRFECGLTVELQPPQLETRLAILRRKMDEWRVVLEEEIVRFLAERIRSNVRRLEGALMRVATYASLAGEAVGVERVEHLLRDLLREEASRQVTIDMIQRAVAEHFDLRLADMTSRRRPSSIAFPRQVAMYLSRHLTKGSLVEIGEAFGGRDHGTVIHACRKVSERMDTEDGVREAVRLLESMLRR